MGVFKRPNHPKKGKPQYWYIRYWYKGKENWESVGKVGIATKALAEAVLAERKKEAKAGDKGRTTGIKPINLNEFVADYIGYVKDIVRKRSWARDQGLIKNLQKDFGPIPFNNLTSNLFINYQRRRLSQGVRPATVNRELACLKHIINVAIQMKRFIGENPLYKFSYLYEDNEQTRVLSYEEEDRLLAASPPYLRDIIICALNTGMRKSEVLYLKWNQVNLNTRIITIDALTAKGKKERKIPINSVLYELMVEGNRQKASSYVFLNSQGRPYKTKDTITEIFKNVCKKLKLYNITFHTLRHTFATRALEAGNPFISVMAILGHRETKTLLRYAHPEASLRETVEAIVRASRSENRSTPDLSTGSKVS